MREFYLQNKKEDQPNTQGRHISAQAPFYRSLWKGYDFHGFLQ